jgi:hypothetical protein
MNWTQVGMAMFDQHPGGGETAQQGAPADADKIMAKVKIWKPLTTEHVEELITLVVQAYQLDNRTPSMRRLAASLIKLAAWRWTTDAVNPVTGIVIPDAIKYDIRYLPHTPNAASVFVQYPNELSKRLRHEHTFPLGLLVKVIFGLETDDRELILKIFETYCRAAIVTKEENDLLNKAKLGSAMPSDWSFGQDLLARYSNVGIELLPPLLNYE